MTDVAHRLLQTARELDAPATGALLVTCADETETECARVFHEGFVEHIVPPLKADEPSALRLANLGGQYEPGAIRMAHEHFAAAVEAGDHLSMVLKINAHVARQVTRDGWSFGDLARYDGNGACCDALLGAVAGTPLPAAEGLRQTLGSDGLDRIAALRDEERVDPDHRALFAAMASTRLQARKAANDIHDHRPAMPVRWLVVASVTINEPQPDTEIVCGIYHSPDPATPAQLEYFGLGDDPAQYTATDHGGQLRVRDEELAALLRTDD